MADGVRYLSETVDSKTDMKVELDGFLAHCRNIDE